MMALGDFFRQSLIKGDIKIVGNSLVKKNENENQPPLQNLNQKPNPLPTVPTLNTTTKVNPISTINTNINNFPSIVYTPKVYSSMRVKLFPIGNFPKRLKSINDELEFPEMTKIKDDKRLSEIKDEKNFKGRQEIKEVEEIEEVKEKNEIKEPIETKENNIPSKIKELKSFLFPRIKKVENSKDNGLILDELLKYQKILLDYSILDFILTEKVFRFIIDKNDKSIYSKILKFLLFELKAKTSKAATSDVYDDMSTLQSYYIFFMLLTLNLKHQSQFIKMVFKENYFNEFHKLINSLPLEKRKVLFSILNNLFLEEYKSIYFKEENDLELELLFINEQTKFSQTYSDSNIYYEKATYEKMFEKLFQLNISYDNFFTNQAELIKEDDKSIYKMSIVQSVIRLVFSKEKSNYYNDVEYCEYDFLSRVIEKDMIETCKKFGNGYKTLFRKEDICDDIIKYMFFIFGNEMIIESFVKPVETIKNEKGFSEDQEITKEDFSFLMTQMIQNVIKTIPQVLKILMKLIYIHAKNVFTIEEDNYSPLYTVLIFNFLISPKLQMIYNLNMSSNFLRSLNRVIRNTCYNTKFDEKESLSIFNQLMDEYNQKLKNFIETYIISIEENSIENKKALSELFTPNNVIYPKFLFFLDSYLICTSITGGVEEIINYEELS